MHDIVCGIIIRGIYGCPRAWHVHGGGDSDARRTSQSHSNPWSGSNECTRYERVRRLGFGGRRHGTFGQVTAKWAQRRHPGAGCRTCQWRAAYAPRHAASSGRQGGAGDHATRIRRVATYSPSCKAGRPTPGRTQNQPPISTAYVRNNARVTNIYCRNSTQQVYIILSYSGIYRPARRRVYVVHVVKEGGEDK